MQNLHRALVLLTVLTGIAAPSSVRGAPSDISAHDAYRAAVQADWAAQERRLGRAPSSPVAVRAAIGRADALLDRLSHLPGARSLSSEKATLDGLRPRIANVQSLNEAERSELYHAIRSATRNLVLQNSPIADTPCVFLKRRRFTTQMLHEYLGYYYDYADIEGGGVHVLDKPGRTADVRDLIRGRLPRGNFTTLALSYDAKNVYFAFCERATEKAKPEFYSAQRRAFHLYAVGIDGRNLRQLTFGPDDDFDPCPLPDGGLAFMSTRRGGFGRCHNPWEPLPTYTLHRLDANGQVRTLSLHETNEWHPSVLADGRIVYTRWDYVDRSAANFHGLWVSNPDGTNPHLLFGNYTETINACYQPRSVPGSKRVMFVAGAHHAAVGGSLVALDPSRVQLDRHSGLDRFEAIERLTPEVCFPEAAGWPKSYFHSPWPLSEDCCLVSMSFDPLPGMGPGVLKDTPTGIYYVDRYGNQELLYREEGISAMYTMPLAPRPAPPIVPSTLDPADEGQQEGELYLADVRRSLMPFPEGRSIASLRIWQVLPKTESHVANQPRLGYANAESARMLLGTVPVERDGSAYFRVPARKPLYFQAVDARGRAVQTMRSITYLQPGERRGCVGCHEAPGTAPPPRQLAALRRPPSTITCGPDGTRPFSFARLVQPVLDRHCVGCHDGAAQAKSKLALTGQPRGEFSVAYESLQPYVRWYEWGSKSVSQAITFPGHGGADESPLLRILEDAHHKDRLTMPEDDRQRIVVWLDGNAPFYGAYSKAERLAQLHGKKVPPPEVQ